MGDLYFDAIDDQKTYPDEQVLSDIRALIISGQREGPVLDYKKDLSEKENWPEAVAAFTNTFGGLIIFGVEGQGDQPREMTGFDPRGVEIKTKLASTLLSRIQPRPNFQIRVVTHDTDRTREVAILRIPEGSHPPYMHSKGDQHDIYIRVGAQKTKADYLQLSALLEKRGKAESEAGSFVLDLAGSQSQLRVTEPGSNLLSRHSYRFILAPDDNRAGRRLTIDVEQQFKHCVEDLYQAPHFGEPIRTPTTTYFRRHTGTTTEQRLALTASGCIGFVTHACMSSETGPVFIPSDFCRNLTDFLILASAFYGESRYYGGNLLDVRLVVSDRAQIHPGVPSRNSHIPGSDLFEPPLQSILADAATVQTRVVLHPVTAERLQGYIEEVMNDLARLAGSVLSPSFRPSIQPLVDDALKRQRTI